MIQYNEYFQSVKEVNKIGFSSDFPIFIPEEYLEKKEFIIFRTCHSYGDWVILSSMPRLLKQKYKDCLVIIPSPECISKMYSSDNWKHKHDNPFNNVIEIFANNPYVDGMIDELPVGVPIYHDHFRIYDEHNPNVPLVKQMLTFWRFQEHEMRDCEPELYWTKQEQDIGDEVIISLVKNKNFGFLYIDDTFFYHINLSELDIQKRRDLIQKQINKHDLPWIYFSGDHDFLYVTNTDIFNIKNINVSLRVQNYIKSKAKVIIGYQGGYGTDCMSRYSDCYVVPLTPNSINEHIQLKTNYL